MDEFMRQIESYVRWNPNHGNKRSIYLNPIDHAALSERQFDLRGENHDIFPYERFGESLSVEITPSMPVGFFRIF